MILTGGGSKLDGLLETLQEQLPYDVMPGKAFQRVAPAMDLVPEAMAAAEPLLAVAVGLAIPGDAA
jgi:Tfp pilus assembly PilM family ATPase